MKKLNLSIILLCLVTLFSCEKYDYTGESSNSNTGESSSSIIDGTWELFEIGGGNEEARPIDPNICFQTGYTFGNGNYIKTFNVLVPQKGCLDGIEKGDFTISGNELTLVSRESSLGYPVGVSKTFDFKIQNGVLSIITEFRAPKFDPETGELLSDDVQTIENRFKSVE